MTSIYVLVNPVTQSPFYVGSTRRSLDDRLTQHLSENLREDFNGIQSKKKEVIMNLIGVGSIPLIKRVAICDDKIANKIERGVYLLLKRRGHLLLQKNSFGTQAKMGRCFEKKEVGVVIVSESVSSFDSIDYNIMRDLANGLTLGEAAIRVHLSSRTVEARVQHMKNELGASTIAHLITLSFKNGLIGFEIDSSSD